MYSKEEDYILFIEGCLVNKPLFNLALHRYYELKTSLGIFISSNVNYYKSLKNKLNCKDIKKCTYEEYYNNFIKSII